MSMKIPIAGRLSADGWPTSVGVMHGCSQGARKASRTLLLDIGSEAFPKSMCHGLPQETAARDGDAYANSRARVAGFVSATGT